jgi:hypothetical protein
MDKAAANWALDAETGVLDYRSAAIPRVGCG